MSYYRPIFFFEGPNFLLMSKNCQIKPL